ncbi:MAG: zeta toxin family protein [Polyangiaceae bacterium]|nr:zeta toxin family protein [Polyangiaceae bacterium]
MRPVLLVIAGPNGAGKTTVTTRLRQDHWSHGVEYLNPDDVAQNRFGDWNSPQATLEAAAWTTARREELLVQLKGIAFETVFSTSEKVDFVRRAGEAGYFVRVFFVGTADPRINAARVASRVMQGGHTVPIEKIVSRYGKSMANLSAAVELADRVYIYDNSVDDVEARLCARTESGKLRKVYGPLPAWVEDAVQGRERHARFVDLRTP